MHDEHWVDPLDYKEPEPKPEPIFSAEDRERIRLLNLVKDFEQQFNNLCSYN